MPFISPFTELPTRSRVGTVTIVAALALACCVPGPAGPAMAAAPEPAAAAAAPLPLGQALQAVTDAGLARLAALEARAKSVAEGASAADRADALAAQAEIIAAKEQMQRDLFVVQLDYARRAGDQKLAAELEGIIERLGAPAVAAPQQRPAPEGAAPTAEVR